MNSSSTSRESVSSPHCSKAADQFWGLSQQISLTVNIVHIMVDFSLAVPTALLNLLLILAIWRTPSLHTPSHLLICALAVADFCVGVIAEPVNVILIFIEMGGREMAEWCNLQTLQRLVVVFFPSLSWAIFTAISVDKLCMLHLHLRYGAIVTNARIMKLIAVISALCGFFTSLQFISMVAFYTVAMVLVVIGIFITMTSYYKIYRTVVRHQRSIHAQVQAIGPRVSAANSKEKFLNFSKYKQSTKSLFLAYMLFILCYIPYCCVIAVLVVKKRTLYLHFIESVVGWFVFMNSFLNTLLILWRLQEIREATRRAAGELTNCT